MKKRLESWKRRTPNVMDTDNLFTQFEQYSWFSVANGNGVIDQSVYEHENVEYDLDNKLANWLMKYDSDINYANSIAFTHEELIELVKTNNIILN
jgi:hypothetical protein